MPRTPAEPDEDLAIPMMVESWAPVVDESPLAGGHARGPARAQPSPVVLEASRWSPADDLALLSAEIAARSDASRSVLLAARAFLRDPLGRDPAVLADWRAAFQLAPRSWVAFWGVRRALSQATAWEDWLAVLDAALGSRTPEAQARRGADHADPETETDTDTGAGAGAGAGAAEGDAGAVPGGGDLDLDPGVEPRGSELRAVQWLEQGRLLEERLGRADEAGASYRAGLRESPEHAGLLVALFWLGCEQGDDELRAEALEGMLRRPGVWAKRAALTVAAVRCRRGDAVGGRVGRPERGDGSGPRARPEARRELLMRTLASAGSPDTRPLLEELAREACATRDDLGQAVAWTDLAARLAPAEDPLAAAMLRRASRLYGRRADQLAVAEATLRAAWRRDSRHPLVASELAAFLEVHGARDGRSLVDALAELLPPDLAVAGTVSLTEAGSELAARWLTACLAAPLPPPPVPSVRPGRPPAGTAGPDAPADTATVLGAAGAFLDGHRRFGHARLDELALRLAVRARAGDGPGLASAFARVAEVLATAVGPAGGMVTGRQGHPAAGAAGRPDADADAGAGGGSGADGDARAFDVRGEAHAFTVCGLIWQDVAAHGALVEAERAWRRALAASPVSVAPAWDRLRELLRRQHRWNELAELLASRLDAAGEGASTAARVGWLEELVVLHRDRLDDPGSAVRHSDRLAALAPDRTRHLVRRWDLELELAEVGRPSPLPVRLELLRALAAAVPGTALAAALSCDAAELALALEGGGGPEARAVAARLFEAALPHAAQGQAASGLERLASSPAERAAIVERELTWARRRGGERAADRHGGPLRPLAFRLAWHHHLDRAPARAVEALAPLVAAGDPAARGLSWHLARGSGEPALARRVLEDARGAGIDVLPLELPFDGAEALEGTGDLVQAEAAFRTLVERASGAAADPEGEAQAGASDTPGDGPGAGARREPVEAALGWLRVAAALGDASATRAATRALAARLPRPERRWLEREARLLSVLDARAVPAVGDPSAALVQHEHPHAHWLEQAREDDGPSFEPGHPGAGLPEREPASSEEPTDAVLRWALGIRSGDPAQVASGLLAIAAIAPGGRGEDHGAPDGGHDGGRADREGLLVRAALRARLGGPATAARVHTHALGWAQAGGAPPRERNLEVALACSLSDLPVEGRPERVAARRARAARTGGGLGYALELECALDAEERGDARGALDGFARALGCDACGIEALDGLRRVAAARGDRRGAASAGLRLGAVIRTPVRAAAELQRAARLLEELGLRHEAAVAWAEALAREPRSDFLFARLEALLVDLRDADGLERLYSGRLEGEADRSVRSRLLLARGRHRLELGAARRGAVHDFKRVLALEPENAEALGHLLDLATGAGALTPAIRCAERLIELESDPEGRGALRLRLATLEASAGRRAQAIATLRRCTRELPGETAAWERLTALAEAGGDASLALEGLRGWEAGLVDRPERARLWLRIGALERAADPAGHRLGAAVVALRTAVELGAGVEGQLALAAALADAGEWAARARLLSEATGEALRRSREAPTDVGLLRELHALSERASRSGGDTGAPDRAPKAGRPRLEDRAGAEPAAKPGSDPGAGAATEPAALSLATIAGHVAAQILGVLGDTAAPVVAPLPAVRFVGELVPPLASPGPGSLAAAIWAVVASAAEALLTERGPRPRPGARTEISAAMRPELAWIEGMAVSLGIPTLHVSVARGPSGVASGVDRQPARGPDRPAGPTDTRAVVAAVDGPRPELVLAADVSARAHEPAVRFEVARTLGLLREHALAFDAITDAELTALFRSAVVLGGGPEALEATVARSGAESADDPTSGALGARALGRALSRKARKALVQAMEGTDLGALDAAGFRAGALEMADRVGLGSCGDLAAAIRAMELPLGTPVLASPRAMRLLRYALSEVFLSAPRERVGGVVVPVTSFGPSLELWVDAPPGKPPEPREQAAPVGMTLNQQEDADQWESELAAWDASLPVLLTPEQPASAGAGPGAGDPVAEEVARWFDEEPPAADGGLGHPAGVVATTDREATLPEMTEEAWHDGRGRFIHVDVDVDVGLGIGRSDAEPALASLGPDLAAWTGLGRLLEEERARAQPPARAFDLHLALARVLERLGEVAEAEAQIEAALDAPGMGSASAGAAAAHRARLCLAERAGHADAPRVQESLQRLALAAHPDQPAYRALWAEWTLARAGRGEVDGAASAYVAAIPEGLGRALAEAELVWSRPATAAAILETAAHRSGGSLGAGLLTLAAALTEHTGDVAAAAEQRFAATRLDGGASPPPPPTAADARGDGDASANARRPEAGSLARPSGGALAQPREGAPAGAGRPARPPPPLGLIRDVARLAPAPALALLAVLMERLGPSPLKVALARWGSRLALRIGDGAGAARQLFEADDVLGPPSLALARARLDVLGSATAASLPGSPLDEPRSEPAGGAAPAAPESIFEHGAAALAEAIRALDPGASGEAEPATRLCLAFSAGVFGAVGPAARGPAVEHLLAGLTGDAEGASEVDVDVRVPAHPDPDARPAPLAREAPADWAPLGPALEALAMQAPPGSEARFLALERWGRHDVARRARAWTLRHDGLVALGRTDAAAAARVDALWEELPVRFPDLLPGSTLPWRASAWAKARGRAGRSAAWLEDMAGLEEDAGSVADSDHPFGRALRELARERRARDAAPAAPPGPETGGLPRETTPRPGDAASAFAAWLVSGAGLRPPARPAAGGEREPPAVPGALDAPEPTPGSSTPVPSAAAPGAANTAEDPDARWLAQPGPSGFWSVFAATWAAIDAPPGDLGRMERVRALALPALIAPAFRRSAVRLLRRGMGWERATLGAAELAAGNGGSALALVEAAEAEEDLGHTARAYELFQAARAAPDSAAAAAIEADIRLGAFRCAAAGRLWQPQPGGAPAALSEAERALIDLEALDEAIADGRFEEALGLLVDAPPHESTPGAETWAFAATLARSLVPHKPELSARLWARAEDLAIRPRAAGGPDHDRPVVGKGVTALFRLADPGRATDGVRRARAQELLAELARAAAPGDPASAALFWWMEAAAGWTEDTDSVELERHLRRSMQAAHAIPAAEGGPPLPVVMAWRRWLTASGRLREAALAAATEAETLRTPHGQVAALMRAVDLETELDEGHRLARPAGGPEDAGASVVPAGRGRAAAPTPGGGRGARRRRDWLRDILRIAPDHAEAFIRLGQMYASEGRHREWSEVLGARLTATRNPFEQTALRLALADCLLGPVGDLAGARRELDLVLEREPQHVGALARLADLEEIAGDLPAVAELLMRQAAVERSAERRFGLFLRLGRLLLGARARDPARAALAYARALQLSPDHREALEALSVLYLEVGETKAGLAVTERLLQTTEEPRARAALSLRKGRMLDRGGDARAAQLTFRHALELCPTELGALDELLRLLDRSHDLVGGRFVLDDLVHRLRGMLAEHPGDLAVARALATLLKRRGRPAAAEAVQEWCGWILERGGPRPPAPAGAPERGGVPGRSGGPPPPPPSPSTSTSTLPSTGDDASTGRRLAVLTAPGHEELLFPPTVPPAFRRLCRELGPLLLESARAALAERVGALGLGRGQRLGDNPVARATWDEVGTALGVGPFQLQLVSAPPGAPGAGSDGVTGIRGPVEVLPGKVPTVVARLECLTLGGPPLADGDGPPSRAQRAALRFAAGRSLFLVSSGLDLALVGDLATLAVWLTAVVRQFVPDHQHPAADPDEVQRWTGRFARQLSKRSRQELAPFALECSGPLPLEALRAGVLDAANRVGLVAAGSLAISAEVLAAAGGRTAPPPPGGSAGAGLDPELGPELARLLAFASSDDLDALLALGG